MRRQIALLVLLLVASWCDGLVEGQKVRLRIQQRDGRQVIYSIAPLPQ
jgi:hypothetical protein